MGEEWLALPRSASPFPFPAGSCVRRWLRSTAAAGPLGHRQDVLAGWRWAWEHVWKRVCERVQCVSTCVHVCALCVSVCPSGLGMQRPGHGGAAGEILEG